jgi:hypothetical protein
MAWRGFDRVYLVSFSVFVFAPFAPFCGYPRSHKLDSGRPLKTKENGNDAP